MTSIGPRLPKDKNILVNLTALCVFLAFTALAFLNFLGRDWVRTSPETFWAGWAEGSVPCAKKGVLNSREAGATAGEALSKSRKPRETKAYSL